MVSVKTKMKQQIVDLVHSLIYKPGMSALPWPFVAIAFFTEVRNKKFVILFLSFRARLHYVYCQIV